MSETFYESRHTGAYIDDQIEQVGKNTSSIAGLVDQLNKININKADKSQIPTSISDLVHDAALVYVGDKAPEDDKYDVWVYLSNDLKKSKIYSRTRDGAWIDTSPATYEMFKVGFRIEKLESGDTNVDCSEKLRDIRNAMDNEQLPIGYELDTHKTFLLQSFSPAYVLFSCVSKDEDGQSVTENIEYIENQGWVYSATPVSSDISGGVQEIYVGSGDMPEGYVLQIDPEGDGIADAGSDELYSLAYYGDINIKPSDSSLFEFTTDDTTMTASVNAKSRKAISGDIVIPYEYVKDGKAYSITSIGSGAFYACTELLSVIIPKGVTTIGYQSFPECYKLASITIPDSVITIDESAFTWDDCLTSITLPESIISIGKYAFLDCKNLSNIYFKGTKEQWDAIDIGGTNNSLETANIHYDWSEDNDSSGEQEIVYANVSTTDGVLTSDKTFDEMYEAVQSGKTVVTIYGAERFTLTKIEPAILWFSSSFSTGDWNGKMRTLMCIKNSDADVWGDHEINLAGTAYVDDAVVEAKPLIVTITGSDIDGYRGDYNYNDVQAAYQAGRDILVQFQGEIYHLRGLNGDVFEFDNLGRDSLNKGVLKMFGCMPLGWMAASDIELASTTYIKQYVEDAILGGAW